MSVTNEENKVSYIADGGASYDIPFYFESAEHIKLYIDDIEAAFTASGAGDLSGGVLTVAGTPPIAPSVVTILRRVPIKQENSFTEGGPFLAKTVEKMFDRLTHISQQVNERVSRAIKLPVSSTVDPELTGAVTPRGMLVLNADATAVEIGPNVDTYMADVLAAAGEVTVNTENSITAMTAAQTAALASQASETAADASAEAAAASAASADASADSAALSELNAETSAQNAGASELNALAYRNTASTHATTATAQAGNATNASVYSAEQAALAQTARTEAQAAATSAESSAAAAAASAIEAAENIAATDEDITVTANDLNKTLNQAILDGDIGGSATDDKVTITANSLNKTLKASIEDFSFFTGAIPQKQTQYFYGYTTAVLSSQAIKGLTIADDKGSGLFSYDDTTGRFTALKAIRASLSFSFKAASANRVRGFIRVNNASKALSHTAALAGDYSHVTHQIDIAAGQYFDFYFDGTSGTIDGAYVTVLAEANSDQILTVPETFSTDTAPLVFSNAYTLATLKDAPIGTVAGYTYNAGGNVRVQMASVGQANSDMMANGIRVYSRPYGSAGHASIPSVIGVQIGKGLKGVSVDVYSTGGKTVPVAIDVKVAGTTIEYGSVWAYDEVSGVLIFDSGLNSLSTITSRYVGIGTEALASPTSAYVVINVSKNPALTGMNVERSGAFFRTDSGQAIGTTNTLITFEDVVLNSCGTYSAGLFTFTKNGEFEIESKFMTNSFVSVTEKDPVTATIYVNGAPVAIGFDRVGFVGSGSNSSGIAKYKQWFNAGDTVSIYGSCAVATTIYSANDYYSYFSITKTSIG